MSNTYKYKNLEQLLAGSNWQAADEETTKLTFQIDSVNIETYVEFQRALSAVSSKIDQFPLVELRHIDQLWRTYSGDHFGFAVQWQKYQKILAEYKQNPQGVEAKYPIHMSGIWTPMTALAIEIGWLSRGAIEWSFDLKTFYSLDAPRGHLPSVGKQELGDAFHHGYLLSMIFYRLQQKYF